jgi:hypothetical protein
MINDDIRHRSVQACQVGDADTRHRQQKANDEDKPSQEAVGSKSPF